MTVSKNFVLLVGFGIALLLIAACADEASQVQNAQQGEIARPADVVDVYHGFRVLDPYRALEDWSDPRVQAWSDGQTKNARAYLDGLPARAELAQELAELIDAKGEVSHSALALAGQRLFALRTTPGAEQPSLVWADHFAKLDDARVVVDMIQLDPEGRSAIDWYKPSHDGRRAAVSISKDGSERGALYVFDVDAGDLIAGPIPNVYNPTAGGDVGWDADGEGFVYTRYPIEGETHADQPNFYSKIRRHQIGRHWRDDPVVLEDAVDKFTQVRFVADPNSNRLIAWIQDGDSGRFAFHFRDEAGQWRQFSRFEDGHIQPVFGDSGDIFVFSNAAAPRGKILKLHADALDWTLAETIVPQRRDASLVHSFYSHFSPTMAWAGGRLFLRYQLGGPTELRVVDRNGREFVQPQLFPISNVYGLTTNDNTALFAVESYVIASRWFSYDVKSGQSSPSHVNGEGADDGWDDVDVRRFHAPSKDGALIPFTVLKMKNAGSGPSRALITGYGGFRTSINPRFRPELRALLERGFIFAEANLRGGGEYGAAWHEAGSLTNKQNVFDDFAAVIRFLHEKGITDPTRTAIIGESNGGLLIGATIVQHPDLVAAAVAKVGLYDMLRAELDPNGAFNIPEYGSVADKRQFDALYAYSPYHNVNEGVAYPAALFMTGANDQRVNPMHSRKMVARLRAATAGETPILLNASRDSGHGAGVGLQTRISDLADAYAFILVHTTAARESTRQSDGALSQ